MADLQKIDKSAPSVNGRAYPVTDHFYDVIVVGAGGAGLRATFGMAEQGLSTACLTKVFPTRSHTVAAQGGISAALGNMGPDDWRWHMYDTDQRLGLAGRPGRHRIPLQERARRGLSSWSTGACRSRRTEAGKIYQRPFGGMTTDYGNGPTAQRTCAAADRTGHAILHTLYTQCAEVTRPKFFIEYLCA